MKLHFDTDADGCMFLRGAILCCQQLSAHIVSGKAKIDIKNEAYNPTPTSGIRTTIRVIIKGDDIGFCPFCGAKIEFILPERTESVQSHQ
jgi:hypothetical protein